MAELENRNGRRMTGMRFGAYIALITIALAWPASAQHGARGGFSSRSGISGHAGFAGHPGFSGSRGISRPSSPLRSNGFARPGFARYAPQARSGFRVPYQGRGVASARPLYRPGFGDRSRGHDRDRWHRPWIGGAYNYGYPGWLGYPYVIDPGLYDWGDSGDNGDGQGLAPGYADASPYGDADGPGPEAPQGPAYTMAPPGQVPMGQQPYARQPYGGAIAPPAPEPEEPITVMFKNGRTPETMQNYMLNSKTLTDLDRQHYEQIPLDQIDAAATEQANRKRGVDFQVPVAPLE